ncbi:MULTISPECIES: allantoate amidohydrolase [Mycobacteriaceae]|uniref:Allantoate amidohydrolase n=1 Tax=Mycolicibacterium mucogenicum TaxID=56689 RepID=A0A4R5WBH1_MYCMU|nr:allantoate amidohydrolase [Mycolicibacterium mucogenicum]TDK86692.1 allantoate amidohydrolase [Mycolicibacterium mucogenicum]
MTDTVTSLLAEIAGTGVDNQRGGYTRPVYSTAELDLRSWFVAHAQQRGLDIETDRNGIIWAWSGGIGEDAVVTGSHLDSVPGGGAYDGPLGVASALVAFDLLAARGVGGRRAIAVFPEEEGSRFGVACLGSRLLTGAIDPYRARSLTDSSGTTFAEASRCAGIDPAHLGPDPETLGRIRTFVELHVEQGRGLIDLGRPVAVASSILGHGRWRLSFTGEGNHAGTTLMTDRSDPMVAAARLITAVQAQARAISGARATVGRIVPVPGGTNVIASRVDLWLDVRHPEDAVTKYLVHEIAEAANAAAVGEGCGVTMTEESFSATVDFDSELRDRLSGALEDAPVLGTGAGHDAGVLKDHVSTAMLFVRNPTGVSHAPSEAVEDADAEAGAVALADSMQHLIESQSARTDPDARRLLTVDVDALRLTGGERRNATSQCGHHP